MPPEQAAATEHSEQNQQDYEQAATSAETAEAKASAAYDIIFYLITCQNVFLLS